MADWMQARSRIAAHIAELRTWLQDGKTGNDDVRLVVCMLSQAQRQLRTADALLGARPETAHACRVAYERGAKILCWGWVWQQ
jgi:hypothetical protein